MRRVFSRRPQLKSVLTIAALLLAVFGAMCLYSESYASVYNITNLLSQLIPLSILAIAQTLVILSGGIDLSLGSMISLTTVLAGKLMDTDSPLQIAFALLAIFGAMGLCGFLNGAGSNFLRVPPLITTLCMSTVLNGVALLIMPVAGGSVNKAFSRFVVQKWDILSMPVVILAIVYAMIHYVLYRTRTGTHIYAIGRSRAISKSMGVAVKSVSIRVYAMAALLAAVAGILLASRMRIGDPLTGANYAMDSITAAAIGGTALSGGVGLISGSVAGAFLVGMLANAMNMIGVDQFYQYVVKGSLLVVAMIIYSLSGISEVKRRGR